MDSVKLELLLLEKVLSPPLLFPVLCELRQMKVMDIDYCDTISVEEHWPKLLGSGFQ